MQQPEFNNLMQGFPAKWAPINTGSKEITKAEIKKAEVQISSQVRDEMDRFIAEYRKIGTKERTIQAHIKTRQMIKRINPQP